MHISQVFSQEKSLKEQALEKFKSENYNDAISLLEQALNHSPNDADIYYYLGWFNHYQAYDKLLIPNNLNRYKDIKTNNIPRISRVALFGYANAVLNLADIYSKSNIRNELEKMIKMYSEKLE